MDINDIRAAVTVVGLLAFVGVWVWAWSRRRKRDFDEAANLPFVGEDKPGADSASDKPKTESRP